MTRHPRILSLRNRLVLVVLGVTLPTIVLALICLVTPAVSYLRQDSSRDLANSADSIRQLMENWDEFMTAVVDNLRGQPAIISMSPEQQKPVMTHMRRVYPRIDFIHTVGLDGNNVTREDNLTSINYADRHWFKDAVAGKSIARQVLISRSTGKPAVSFAAPIQNSSGATVGVLCVGMNLLALDKILDQTDLGASGYIVVADAEGHVLAHSRRNVARTLTDVSAFPETYRAIQAGQPDAHITDAAGEVWLGRVHTLANGWRVAAVQREREVLAPATHLAKTTTLTITVLVLLLTASTWLIATRMTRPIAGLKAAAEALAAGHWDTRAPLQSRDEIGVLATAFNTMADQLQRNYRDIEAQVARRTAELQQANTQLAAAREAAERANRAKDEFLANMSHEIRTPMTAVLGYADLLLETNQTPSDREDALLAIRRNARHLADLISDILDISKIEAGRMTLERVPCDLPQLLGEVVSLMRLRAREKGLDFRVSVAGPIPRTIRTDPTRLRQVLVNLLGNAIKFTSRGAITIRLACPEAPQPALEIHVADTGIGLTPPQLARLFKPFTQGDESTTRKFGGTGLGLAISKHLANALGGDILVTSELGVGSTFTVRIDPGPLDPAEMLPDEATATAAMGVRETPSEQVTLRGQILLAEDGLDNQRLISLHLRQAGAEVTLAENGRLAVELASRQRFDLILMDMQMPEMDGYTATAELRRRGQRLPIIALTAHAMASDRTKCLEAGCDAYLTKPIARSKLLETVRTYLAGSAQLPAPCPQAQPHALPPAPPPGVVSPAASTGLLVSPLASDPGLQGLVQTFIAALPTRVSTIHDLAVQGQLDDLRRAVHQIKGAAGGYGFPSITAAAAIAETTLKQTASIDAASTQIDALLALIRTVAGYDPARELATPKNPAT